MKNFDLLMEELTALIRTKNETISMKNYQIMTLEKKVIDLEKKLKGESENE